MACGMLAQIIKALGSSWFVDGLWLVDMDDSRNVDGLWILFAGDTALLN